MGSRLFRPLIWLACAVFSACLHAAPYQVTVLATNIADYGGLGEWSFAALFQSEQDAVLFDTGFKQDTVLHNVQHLNVDLSQVEKVVLSHFHSDHGWPADAPRAFSPSKRDSLEPGLCRERIF